MVTRKRRRPAPRRPVRAGLSRARPARSSPRTRGPGSGGSGVVWVLVNCNSTAEAQRIGDAVLQVRAASCYDVFPRERARYFWPPRAGKIETARGVLLVIETFADRFAAVAALVQAHHRDELPFIGELRIENVPDAYQEWMRGEIRSRQSGRLEA